MLLKLTSQFPRETQIGLVALALLGMLTALLFGGGAFGVRATYFGATFLVFPIAFGMMWLILMAHVWVAIAPKGFMRFVSNFFFIFSVFAGCIAVALPLFTKDPEQPGSSALMAAGMLGFGLAAFKVYKKHLMSSSNAA